MGNEKDDVSINEQVKRFAALILMIIGYSVITNGSNFQLSTRDRSSNHERMIN